MAVITLVDKNDSHEWEAKVIVTNGFAWEWIAKNIEKGTNYGVYDGEICESNDISRDLEKMEFAQDVTVAILPGGPVIPFIPYIIAAVAAVAVVLLMPEVDTSSTNNNLSSSNNALSDRTNDIRLGGRYVDFVGENYSIPDVLQPEWSKYVDGNEVRIGAYAFGRNTVDVKSLSDGESLIEDRDGASAGIYRPYTSPNNSAPFEQIGDAINEPIVGVYQSTDAINQTLEAPDALTASISTGGSGKVGVDKSGGFGWLIDSSIDFASDYPIGTKIEFFDLYIKNPNGNEYSYINLTSSGSLLVVTGNAFGQLEFSIDNNDEWLSLPGSYVDYDVVDETLVDGVIIPDYYVDRYPKLQSSEAYDGDTYLIKRRKVDRLLFNVYAPNGIYKRSSGDKESVSVSFRVAYYRLDDDYNRIGSLQTQDATISDATDNSIGETIDIDLGAQTYVEWYIYRTTFEDAEYNGTVVDVIKLKSVYGLFDLDQDHWGNITMCQTQRKQLLETSSIANPEVNATCTEMVYKYLGNGVFDTELTTNTQAMQSLIAKALDPKIGRLTVDDLDLDGLLQAQEDNETYYQTNTAGKCSYSFDDANTSAQDTFYLIANAASIILWREGRVLKAWFERPQSVPEMVFTHRSKIIGGETWSQNFNLDYDGVEFPYIDEDTNDEEVLTFPEDASNTKSIDIDGIRGLEQATWRMYREYYKLMNQRITVDFTATAEGRFANPAKLISVVKGTRVGQTGGYIKNVSLLTVELSQEVAFTEGDDHFLVLKTRNGGTQTVSVTETDNPRIVNMDFAPIEEIYYGNDALKTEFSFGNEARLTGQLMLPQTIDSSNAYETKITAVNYSDKYYQGDTVQPIKSGFSDGFDDGFF